MSFERPREILSLVTEAPYTDERSDISTPKEVSPPCYNLTKVCRLHSSRFQPPRRFPSLLLPRNTPWPSSSRTNFNPQGGFPPCYP
jgi:hypothetical protein